MRVLWLSPWMRTLARVQVDALHAAGHECLLITSDQHYEPMRARGYERVLDPRPRDPRTLPPLLRTLGEARRFRPDVVIAELVWDPRWLAFTRLAPLVHLVHDDQPHDATETRPAWQRALFAHLGRRAVTTIAFSAHVAGRLGRAEVVPLTSDVGDAELPPEPARRRDFVLYGRLSPYKNVPVVLRAWQRHRASPAYRGDRLLLIGDGPLDVSPGDLPPGVEWRRGRFGYADVLPVLAAAKGSLAHYRLATQSGVQLLSLQLGVTPVVSDSGGLGEFQPPGEPGIGVDDVAGLAAAFDALADPAEAARRGAAARAHYRAHFAADRSAHRLAEVLSRASTKSGHSGRIVADSWYAGEIPGATTLNDVLARWPVPVRRLAERSGALRGVALFWAGRRAAVIVTTNAAPGASACAALCGLTGRRALVLLEYIVHPPARRSGPRWAYFVLLRRWLLGRALLRAQVLSAGEVARYPALHRMPPGRFALLRWPARFDDTAPGPPVGGRRVLASGRRTDWATFFAAAAGTDWQVRAVCTGADLPDVRARAAGTGATVRHDISADEHQAEVAAATVYVLAVPETGASIGQIRVSNATQAGVPLVASDVAGLRDYLDDGSAELVPPGDPGALRSAVDALLADPDRRAALRRGARRRGDTMADYLAGIRALVADAAVEVKRR